MAPRYPNVWNEDDGVHIDVRGLPPPEPMVEIVRLIQEAMPDATIIAHLDRDPIHLYPELDERGWGYEVVSEMPGDVRLRLERVS